MLEKILMSDDILYIWFIFVLAAMFGIGITYAVWEEVRKWWRRR